MTIHRFIPRNGEGSIQLAGARIVGGVLELNDEVEAARRFLTQIESGEITDYRSVADHEAAVADSDGRGQARAEAEAAGKKGK